MSKKDQTPRDNRIILAYQRGGSIQGMGRSLRMKHAVIRQALKRHGVKIR